jgi:hypothetical protein
VGSLGGCTAKDCNPSHPKGGALFGGLGCALFGGYAKRRAIMQKRVKLSEENLQISKNRYYKTLLEYQKFMAKLTQDDSKLKDIEKGIKEIDKEAQEIAILYDEIVEEEDKFERNATYIKATKKVQISKTISQKKKKFRKKIKQFAKNKRKLTKKMLISKKQQKYARAKKREFIKKRSKGLITKKENLMFKKTTSILNGFKKANSDALKESKRTTMKVYSLITKPAKRMKDDTSKILDILGISFKLKNSSKKLM